MNVMQSINTNQQLDINVNIDDDESVSFQNLYRHAMTPSVAMEQQRHTRDTQAIIAWANVYLRQRNMPVSSLADEFFDGVRLINLLEVSFRVQLPVYNPNPQLKHHYLDNLVIAYDFLEQSGVPLLNVGVHDIVNRVEKSILVLLWTLMRHLAELVIDAPSPFTTLNVNDTDESETPFSLTIPSLQHRMISWLQRDVPRARVVDCWESFRSGMSMCYLVARLCPDKIDIESMRSAASRSKRLKRAFNVAEAELGIQRLVTPKQFEYGEANDDGSVANYVYMLLTAAAHRYQWKHNTKLKPHHQMMPDTVSSSVVCVTNASSDDLTSSLDGERAVVASRRTSLASVANDDDELALYREEFELMSRAVMNAHEKVLSASQRNAALRSHIVRLQTQLDAERERTLTQQERITELNSEVYAMHNELQDVSPAHTSSSRKPDATHTTHNTHTSHTHNTHTPHTPHTQATTKFPHNNNNTEEQRMTRIDSQLAQLVSMDEQDRARPQRSRSERMAQLPVLQAHFMRRKVKSGLRRRTSLKARYFELRGDTILYAHDENSMIYATRICLENYQFAQLCVKRFNDNIDDELNGSSRDTFCLVLNARVDVPHTRTPPPDFQLIPTARTSSTKHTMSEWRNEINKRIVLANAFARGIHTLCPKLIDFVVDSNANELVIERSVPKLHRLLLQFINVIRRRKNLIIKLTNIALLDRDLAVVARLVEHSKTIVTLDVSDNTFTANSIAVLAQALRRNTSLQNLSLSGCDIGDRGVIALSSCLTNHSRLRSLALARTGVSDVGVAALSDALITSTKRNGTHIFPCIELSHNNITAIGVQSLAKLIRCNHSINNVQLSHNNVSDAGVTAIMDAMVQRGVCLQEIALAGNALTSRSARCIADTLSQFNDNVRIDLSHNKGISRQALLALVDDGDASVTIECFRVLREAKDASDNTRDDDDDDDDDDGGGSAHNTLRELKADDDDEVDDDEVDDDDDDDDIDDDEVNVVLDDDDDDDDDEGSDSCVDTTSARSTKSLTKHARHLRMRRYDAGSNNNKRSNRNVLSAYRARDDRHQSINVCDESSIVDADRQSVQDEPSMEELVTRRRRDITLQHVYSVGSSVVHESEWSE